MSYDFTWDSSKCNSYSWLFNEVVLEVEFIRCSYHIFQNFSHYSTVLSSLFFRIDNFYKTILADEYELLLAH